MRLATCSLIKRENAAGSQRLNLIRAFWWEKPGQGWHRVPHLSPGAAALLARPHGGGAGPDGGGARRGRRPKAAIKRVFPGGKVNIIAENRGGGHLSQSGMAGKKGKTKGDRLLPTSFPDAFEDETSQTRRRQTQDAINKHAKTFPPPNKHSIHGNKDLLHAP